MKRKTEYISIDLDSAEVRNQPFTPEIIAELFRHEDDPIWRHESKLVLTANILLGLTFTVLVLIFIQTWWAQS